MDVEVTTIPVPTSVCGIWRKIERNLDGDVVQDVVLKNLVTNVGKDQLIANLLALTASAGVIALGVGASTTTATVSDTRLTYELIGNATRKTLTNTSGAALSPSDIVTGNTTIVINATSSATFTKSITCQATYNSGDGNNGNQFGEYGLFTLVTNPGTPTSTSGVIFNHLIDPDPTFKNASNSVTIQISLYF